MYSCQPLLVPRLEIHVITAAYGIRKANVDGIVEASAETTQGGVSHFAFTPFMNILGILSFVRRERVYAPGDEFSLWRR